MKAQVSKVKKSWFWDSGFWVVPCLIVVVVLDEIFPNSWVLVYALLPFLFYGALFLIGWLRGDDDSEKRR